MTKRDESFQKRFEHRLRLEADIGRDMATKERFLELLDNPGRASGLIADLINLMDVAEERVERFPKEKRAAKEIHKSAVRIINWLCELKILIEDNHIH